MGLGPRRRWRGSGLRERAASCLGGQRLSLGKATEKELRGQGGTSRCAGHEAAAGCGSLRATLKLAFGRKPRASPSLRHHGHGPGTLPETSPGAEVQPRRTVPEGHEEEKPALPAGPRADCFWQQATFSLQ